MKTNVDLANLSDKKMFDFAKEMYFDERVLGNKSTRDISLTRLLNHMVSRQDLSNNQIQDGCHLMLTNYVIEKKYYYKRNKLENFSHNK